MIWVAGGLRQETCRFPLESRGAALGGRGLGAIPDACGRSLRVPRGPQACFESGTDTKDDSINEQSMDLQLGAWLRPLRGPVPHIKTPNTDSLKRREEAVGGP